MYQGHTLIWAYMIRLFSKNMKEAILFRENHEEKNMSRLKDLPQGKNI